MLLVDESYGIMCAGAVLIGDVVVQTVVEPLRGQ
jgi:hypothetical protein